MKSKQPRRQIGGRSEISLLVHCTLLLLVLLSSFQLFVLRDTVSRLIEEQRAQASSWALEVSTRLVDGPWPPAMELRRWLPGAESLTVYDAEGRPVASTGGEMDFAAADGVIVGEASFLRGGVSHRVEVRFSTPVLNARRKSLAILTPLVVIVDLGVLILMVAYVRRWLRPLDLLLDRARALGQAPQPADEVAFLMRTFERALEELSEPAQDEGLRILEGALVRSMQSGVLLTDREGHVLALNEIGANILQVEKIATQGGSPLEQVLSAHPALVTLLRGAIGGEVTVQRQECAIELPSGRRELGLTAHPLRRDDGLVQGWLVMFADLTDVKRRLADEKLSDSLRQIGELTAGVAHEMRNGLATLKGYLALIERAEEPRAIDGYLRELRQETEHLHRVLEDFLSFARPGSMRTEDVDLIALVQKVAADPARFQMAGSAGIKVDTAAVAGGATIVRGDPVLLARALGNLVNNALQAQRAVEAEEPVTLSLVHARTPDPSSRGESLQGLLVRLEDRGAGLPDDVRERLFEAFVSGRPDGVGLGLPLAQRIVLLHGGEIRLEAREGGGTVVEVFLPTGKNVTDRSS